MPLAHVITLSILFVVTTSSSRLRMLLGSATSYECLTVSMNQFGEPPNSVKATEVL